MSEDILLPETLYVFGLAGKIILMVYGLSLIKLRDYPPHD
jgi:hypothetical protein